MEYYEQKVQYFRAIFDTIPVPTFIMDEDCRIQDFNAAAEAYLGPEPALALHRRGGEVLHCIHADVEGCGKAEPCKDCIIRKSVGRALGGKATYRAMHQAELHTKDGTANIDLLVSASLLPYTESPRALVVLENVNEIVAMKGSVRKPPARKAGQRRA
jgi:PAS domain-containing protein